MQPDLKSLIADTPPSELRLIPINVNKPLAKRARRPKQ